MKQLLQKLIDLVEICNPRPPNGPNYVAPPLRNLFQAAHHLRENRLVTLQSTAESQCFQDRHDTPQEAGPDAGAADEFLAHKSVTADDEDKNKEEQTARTCHLEMQLTTWRGVVSLERRRADAVKRYHSSIK